MNKKNKLTLNSNKTPTRMKEDFDDDLRLKFTAKKIAFKIYFELKNKKMTQQDLAVKLNVSPQNISKILKGDDFKLSTLVRLEEALSINLIDRNIISINNNVSTMIYFKVFNLQKKPLITSELPIYLENKIHSNEIITQEVFSRKVSFENLKKTYSCHNEI